MPTKYPAYNYWKYCPVLGSWAFSEEDVANYWIVTRCYFESPMPYPWDQQSYPGDTWASIEFNHIRWRPYPSPHQQGEKVPSSVRDQSGADQANWTLCFCPRGPKMFSISWISLKTCRRGLQINSWYTGTRLKPSEMVSSDICRSVQGQPIELQWPCPNVSSCCWKVNGLLYKKTRIITLVKAEPGLISNYHMRPVLMIPVLVTAQQYVPQVAMISVSLYHLFRCFEQYPATAKRPSGKTKYFV